MSETTTRTVKWPGTSGQSYTYYIYDWPTTFKKARANYIFCKLVNNEWTPIYIGETSDLSERYDSRDAHALDCINRNGATHIHVHASSGDQARLDEETDLRHNFDTPCNKQ